MAIDWEAQLSDVMPASVQTQNQPQGSQPQPATDWEQELSAVPTVPVSKEADDWLYKSAGELLQRGTQGYGEDSPEIVGLARSIKPHERATFLRYVQQHAAEAKRAKDANATGQDQTPAKPAWMQSEPQQEPGFVTRLGQETRGGMAATASGVARVTGVDKAVAAVEGQEPPTDDEKYFAHQIATTVEGNNPTNPYAGYDPRSWALSTARMAAPLAATTAAGMAGGPAAAEAAGVAVFAPDMTRSAYNEARDSGFDEDTASKIGYVSGLAQAAIFAIVPKAIQGQLAKIPGLNGGINSALGRFLAGTAKGTVEGAGVMATAESANQLAQDVAGQLKGKADASTINTVVNAAKRWGEGFAGGLGPSFVMAAPSHAGDAFRLPDVNPSLADQPEFTQQGQLPARQPESISPEDQAALGYIKGNSPESKAEQNREQPPQPQASEPVTPNAPQGPAPALPTNQWSAVPTGVDFATLRQQFADAGLPPDRVEYDRSYTQWRLKPEQGEDVSVQNAKPQPQGDTVSPQEPTQQTTQEERDNAKQVAEQSESDASIGSQSDVRQEGGSLEESGKAASASGQNASEGEPAAKSSFEDWLWSPEGIRAVGDAYPKAQVVTKPMKRQVYDLFQKTSEPGTQFTMKDFPGSLFETQPDGTVREMTSGRTMGNSAQLVVSNALRGGGKVDDFKFVKKPAETSDGKVENPQSTQDYSKMSKDDLQSVRSDLYQKYNDGRAAVQRPFQEQQRAIDAEINQHYTRQGTIRKGGNHSEEVERLLTERDALSKSAADALEQFNKNYGDIERHPAVQELNKRYDEDRKTMDAAYAKRRQELQMQQQKQADELSKRLDDKNDDVSQAAQTMMDFYDQHVKDEPGWQKADEPTRTADRNNHLISAFDQAQRMKDAIDSGNVGDVEKMFGLKNPMWVKAFQSLTGQQIPDHNRKKFFRDFFGADKYDAWHENEDRQRQETRLQNNLDQAGRAIQNHAFQESDGTQTPAKEWIDRQFQQGFNTVDSLGRKGAVPIKGLANPKTRQGVPLSGALLDYAKRLQEHGEYWDARNAELAAKSSFGQKAKAALAGVPALKDSKIAVDDNAKTAAVTLPDGQRTTVHFEADAKMDEIEQAMGRKAKGAYILGRNEHPGVVNGDIYIRKAAKSDTLNHEVVHWLEDVGVLSHDEVAKAGGSEAFAKSYGEWVAGGMKEKSGAFQRAMDFMRSLLGDQEASKRRLFEKVAERTEASDKQPKASEDAGEQAKAADEKDDATNTDTVSASKPDWDNLTEDAFVKELQDHFQQENATAEKEATPAPEPAKKKTLFEKPILSEASKAANKEAADAIGELRDFLNKRGVYSNPFADPDLIALAGKVTYRVAKAGVLDFADFVKAVSRQFTSETMDKLAPVLEKTWDYVREKYALDGMSPSKRVSDILNPVEKTTKETENVAGHKVLPDAGVEDGVGQSGANAPAVSGRTGAKRRLGKRTKPEGERVPPDHAENEGEAAKSDAGGDQGDRTGRVPDAGQSELAGRKTADESGKVSTERGSDRNTTKEDDLSGKNHVIEPDDELAVPSLKESLRRNVRAVELVKQLEEENRNATPEEKKELAQFTGWGGLSQVFDDLNGRRMVEDRYYRDAEWEKKWGNEYKKLKSLLTPEEWDAARSSTLNAHYTSKDVIQKMWSLADRLGFRGGKVLEPGAGIGHFAGLTPTKFRGRTKFTMVEMDSLSSRMLRKLYPEAGVEGKPFEDVRVAPGSTDMVIGNVPFAQEGPNDAMRRYGLNLNLHNYFIARALDAVRPGGIVEVISTHNTLDAQAEQRKFLASKGELIGAIRLPNNAFAKNAKTEVVTDILVFRRPVAGQTLGENFTGTAPIELQNEHGQAGTARINQYFVDHPEQVLGKQTLAGSMYRSNEYTVEPTPGDLQTKIDEAIARIPDNVAGDVATTSGPVVEESLPDEEREGSLSLKDGKLSMVVNGKSVAVEPKQYLEGYPKNLFTESGMKRANDYMALRDAYANLRTDMLSPESTDADIKADQRKMDKLYDAYVAKHGNLNGLKTSIFKFDPEFYRVLSLEEEHQVQNVLGVKHREYTKAAVFTQRTLGPRIAPDVATDVKDGVHVSLGYKGKVDVPYIAALTGKSTEDVEKSLVADKLAFRDPTTQEFVNESAYLSGNVRKKLRDAEVAAEDDSSYKANVEALQAVQPERVPVEKISYRLGSTWMPEDVVSQFATKAFGERVSVRYSPQSDSWRVEAPGRSAAINQTFGTERMSGDKIVESLLNLRTPQVFDSIGTGEYDANGREKKVQVLNEKETAAVKAIAVKLQNEFRKWAASNDAARQRVEDVYNEERNAYVDAKYSGSHLDLPGCAADVQLRPYQKDAIARIIQDGSCLLSHAVGAGKTYTMIGAAMEQRRLGLAKRPMLVVQNATLGQFASSFMRMYPDAKVLVADKDDLASSNRQLFLSRATSGDWDAVVMAQSTFDRLASKPDVERQYLNDMIGELSDSIEQQAAERGKRDPSVKDQVRAKKALEERLDKLMEAERKNRETNRLYFDDLGVDSLFLDEAHAYKKPFFLTKLPNLVGLNKQVSNRGVSTMMKVRTVQSQTGGRNIVLATGTPITNTLGEAWHMVNFVNPKLNQDYGCNTFDQFISSFAMQDTIRDMNAGGKWVMKDALVRFTNGPELMHYLRAAWDILSPDDLKAFMKDNGTALPQLKGGKVQAVTIDQTPAMQKFSDFMSAVYDKFKGLSSQDRKEKSYVPVLTYGASRAAALDIRLVIPDAKDESGSKLNRCVDLAFDEYNRSADRKGVQLIFSDTFNSRDMTALHDFMKGEKVDLQVETNPDADANEESQSFLFHDIKKKLMSKGVPESEIAIVSEANTDARREALFTAAQQGDVRFLLGSSAKMGVGVNVQNKIVALHHLDAPWLPADVEQREGRAIRYGNENKEVAIYRYAMQKTLDAAIFSKTSRKAKFIWQVLSGKLDGREFEDPASEMTMSIDEQLAAIQGDPRLFEKMDLDKDRRDLQYEEEAHQDSIVRARASLRDNRDSISRMESVAIPAAERRTEALAGIDMASPNLTIDGKLYTKSEQSDKALKDVIAANEASVMKRVASGDLKPQSATRIDAAALLGHKELLSEPFEIAGLQARVASGAYRDLDGKLHADSRVALSLPNEPTINLYDGQATTVKGLWLAARGLAEKQDSYATGYKQRVEQLKKDNAELQSVVDTPWPGQKRLDEINSRLADLEADLVANKEPEQSPSPQSDTVSPSNGTHAASAAGVYTLPSGVSLAPKEAKTLQGRGLFEKLAQDSERGDASVGRRTIFDYLAKMLNSRMVVARSQVSGKHPGLYREDAHLWFAKSGVDAPTDLHEAGHALYSVLNDAKAIPESMRKKLAEFASMQTPPNGMASAVNDHEGMAELLRCWMSNPDSIPRDLRDEFDKAMQKVPKLTDAMDDVRKAYQFQENRPPMQQWQAAMNDKPVKHEGGMLQAARQKAYDVAELVVGPSVLNSYMERNMYSAVNRGAKNQVRAEQSIVGMARTDRRLVNKAFHEMMTRNEDTPGDVFTANQMLYHAPSVVSNAIYGTNPETKGIRVHAMGDVKEVLTNDVVKTLKNAGIEVPDVVSHGHWLNVCDTSLEDVKAKLGNDYDKFNLYGQYRTALYRFEKFGHKYPLMDRFPPDVLKTALADTEKQHPDWRDCYKDVQKIYQQSLLLDVLSGERSADEVAKMAKEHEEFWSLPRQVENSGTSGGSGNGENPTSGIRYAHGSTLPFMSAPDALEQRLRRSIGAYYDMAAKRAIPTMVEQFRQSPDWKTLPFESRKFIESMCVPLKLDTKVAVKLNPVEQSEMIAKGINRYLEEEKGSPLTAEEKVQPEDVNLDNLFQPVYRKNAPRIANVFSTFDPRSPGQRQYYFTPDRLIWQLNVGRGSSSTPILQTILHMLTAAAKVARPTERAITQSLAFPIRNIGRDAIQALMQSSGRHWKEMLPGYYHAVGLIHDVLGGDASEQMATEMVSRAIEGLHHEQHKGVWNSFKRTLAEGVLVRGYGDMSWSQRLGELPGQVKSAVAKPIDVFNWLSGGKYLSSKSEEAPRTGAFVAARKEGISPMTAQAKYADMITGNFTQHSRSPLVREAIRTLMFANPALQCAWQTWDQATHPDPAVRAKFWSIKAPVIALTGMAAAASTVALWRSMYDDDEFKKRVRQETNRSEWDRLRYWNAGWMKVPFEYGFSGAIQSTAYVMTMDKLIGHPGDKGVLAQSILQKVSDLPNLLPPEVGTAMELYVNHSFFFDKPIVHQALLDAYPNSPYMQCWDDTPTVYKQAGQVLNVSPEKIRYATRNLLSSTADDLVSGVGMLSNNQKLGDVEPSDYPVIGRLIAREPRGYASQPVKDVRALAGEFTALRKQIDQAQKDGVSPTQIGVLREQLSQVYYGKMFSDIIDQHWKDAKQLRKDGDVEGARQVEREMTNMALAYFALVGESQDSPDVKNLVEPALRKAIANKAKRVILSSGLPEKLATPRRRLGESMDAYEDRVEAAKKTNATYDQRVKEWQTLSDNDKAWLQAHVDDPIVQQAIKGVQDRRLRETLYPSVHHNSEDFESYRNRREREIVKSQHAREWVDFQNARKQ